MSLPNRTITDLGSLGLGKTQLLQHESALSYAGPRAPASAIRNEGKAVSMVLLLVDDRDGRIVSEIETEDEAQDVLEAWLREDGSIPEYFCLIELHSHHGALLGADSSVKIRPLSGN